MIADNIILRNQHLRITRTAGSTCSIAFIAYFADGDNRIHHIVGLGHSGVTFENLPVKLPSKATQGFDWHFSSGAALRPGYANAPLAVGLDTVTLSGSDDAPLVTLLQGGLATLSLHDTTILGRVVLCSNVRNGVLLLSEQNSSYGVNARPYTEGVLGVNILRSSAAVS